MKAVMSCVAYAQGQKLRDIAIEQISEVLEDERAFNVAVDGPGHLSVLFDPRIADRVTDFLLSEELLLEH